MTKNKIIVDLRLIDIKELTEEQIKELADYINRLYLGDMYYVGDTQRLGPFEELSDILQRFYGKEMKNYESNILKEEQFIELIGRLSKYLKSNVKERTIFINENNDLVMDCFFLGAINMALLFILEKEELAKEKAKMNDGIY